MGVPLKYEACVAIFISLFSLMSILSHAPQTQDGAGAPSALVEPLPVANATLHRLLRRESLKALEAKLLEQISRAQELEALYSEEHSKRKKVKLEQLEGEQLKQQLARIAKEKEEAQRKGGEYAWFKSNVEKEKNALLSELERALYLDSLVMQHFLEANRTQLQAAWQARLSGQRQRGVVISGGGPGPMTNAFVSLYVLRHHLKCALPAVILYYGKEGDTVDDKAQKIFKEHLADVEFMDASKAPYPAYHRPLAPRKPDGRFVGWKVKVFALYAAPFKEVLFLDSDNIPLLDPTGLFEVEQYAKHGNLYWPDVYNKDTLNKHITQRLFDVLKVDNPWARPSPPRQAEAGQFLINRQVHWDVLEWLLFLNTHTEVVYRLFWGDKDTHRLAFHLAGKGARYMQVAQPPAFTMNGVNTQACLQLHPNGTVIFSHHTSRKYDLRLPGGLPAITHVTAQVSSDLGTHLVFYGLPKVEHITPAKCKYTLWNLPADQRACTPQYDPEKGGLQQGLPLFEYLPDSHIARAESVGYEGFTTLRDALKT